MSLNEIEEDGKVVVEFTNIVDKELIDSIVNEPLLFDNLDIEADVNELDDIKNMCEHYAKHMDLMIMLRINLSINSLNVFV